MINKTVVIVGSLALLGVGAFIYFKPKAIDKSMDTLGDIADLGGASGTSGTNSAGVANASSTSNSSSIPADNTVVQTRDKVTGELLKEPIVKTLTNTDIIAIQKLRDDIIGNMGLLRKYKKQSSRNNLQADINNQFNRLKEYGYSLDTNNNLIKIVPDYSGGDFYKYDANKNSSIGIKDVISPIGRLFR